MNIQAGKIIGFRSGSLSKSYSKTLESRFQSLADRQTATPNRSLRLVCPRAFGQTKDNHFCNC